MRPLDRHSSLRLARLQTDLIKLQGQGKPDCPRCYGSGLGAELDGDSVWSLCTPCSRCLPEQYDAFIDATRLIIFFADKNGT